jgi:transcriptional antiterminator RfaH
MSSVQWYVVHTQQHQEARAQVNLRRQGFATYLPVYQRARRHAGRIETVIRPLFPRYMFVAIDIQRERWRSVNSTFGVSSLVSAGDEPLPVAEEVVEEIRAREDDKGLVKIGLPAGIGPGSAIRLIDGIFADARGVLERVADQRRVSVLLQLLGRNVRVFVPSASIGAA